MGQGAPRSHTGTPPQAVMVRALLAVLVATCVLYVYHNSAPTRVTFRAAPNCHLLGFRTLSGVCTSYTNPTWGAAGSPLLSYVPNHSSVVPTGQELKNARVISNLLSAQSVDTVNAHRLNELWPYFALFLAHDLIDTPFTGPMMPIITPPDDPYLPPGIPIFFRRSERVPTNKKNEEPVNRVSSAADLSGVYGVDETRNAQIRVPGSAKLLTSAGNLLPLNTLSLPNVPDNSPHFYCAGDPRANETPVLLIFHTIFLREHNRLVDEISSRVPYLSVEQVYLLARKINIAQYQKIVYEEFYPALVSLPLPPYRLFRPTANPSVSNVFASAAGAIGTNMVGRTVRRRTKDGSSLPGIPLKDSINRNVTEHPLTPSDVDNLIRGSAWTFAQENDLQMHDGLRSTLVEAPFGKVGFDLAAIILQRGRDQALPTYNELRVLLGLEPVSIKKISSDPKVVALINAAYDGKADDVEAWVGIVAEDKLPGGGVGITGAHAWRREFMRLRDGDRLFYLIKDRPRKILRHRLHHLTRDLYDKKKKLLRELITRNTGVTDKQLPPGDIFQITGS